MFQIEKKMLLIFLFALLILSACNKISAEPITTDTIEKIDESKLSLSPQKNECLLPAETFAYSISPESNSPLPAGYETGVLPISPWQVDTSIPDKTRYLSLLATRFLNRQIELWILATPSTEQGTKDNSHEFLVYYPSSKSWKTVSAKIKGSQNHVDELFVAQDGSIFGHPYIDTDGDASAISILSKYSEETEEFEFVNELQNIPTSSIATNGFHSPSKVVLDVQGTTFWIFVPDDAIFSYDLISRESKKHITLPDTDILDLAVDLVISPDGDIYYLSFESNVFTNSNIWLYRFEPSIESVERIAIKLEPWPLASTIFVDHSSRLWFGGVGWLEPDGTWYQMLRSPIFVTNTLESGLEYRWKSPKILMESSDNRLWLESENGLVWLNPTAEKWCWFTTYRSNIVEDQDRNLWMVADGKLYKYPLNP